MPAENRKLVKHKSAGSLAVYKLWPDEDFESTEVSVIGKIVYF